jgi:hypothetical protein
MRSSLTVVLVMMLLLTASAFAQWPNQAPRGVPRTSDGKPNLAAAAPRTRDGKPDLGGVWRAEPDPKGKPEGVEHEVFPRYFVNVAADRANPFDLPFKGGAADVLKERLMADGKEDPQTRCVPPGVPAANTFPLPLKIIQTPEVIAILYEVESTFRQVFLDGRKHPVDPVPTLYGYSVGRWEGATLVVESTGFKDGGWLDRMGHPHSDQLKLVERFTRRDFGHMDVAMTIDDPKTYTQPFTYTQRWTLLPETELLEYYCTENERSRAHFK